MKPAVVVTTVFLVVIAIAHLLRVVAGVPITVDDMTIPMWPSVVAVLITGGLAVWLMQTARPGRT